MTDQPETGNPTTETVVTEQEAPAEEAFDRARAMELIDKLRRENRDLEKARKRLDALEKAEQERKQSEMSELEKAQQRLAQVEAEANALKLKDLQRQAAEKAGLPAALASRLQGATLEELELDATALAETLPKPQPKTPPPIPAANPGNAQQGETDAQRRARLYGSTFDPFDPKTAQEHGGGVVFKIKE